MRIGNIPRWLIALALTFAAVGCASAQYTYVPSELAGLPSSKARDGKAFYLIPADAPTGNVRIMSGGLARLRPDSGGPRVRAVHVRIVLSNQSSATPWSVAPQELAVSFPNQATPVYPIQSRASVPSSPIVSVAKGELRSLDLYFALPASAQSAQDLPEFDFHWAVKIGALATTKTTSFDRQELPEYDVPPYRSYNPYWGGGFGWGAWAWGGGTFVE